VPDISLVVLFPLNLTQGFLDGSASITDGARPLDPVVLQIPQHQGPPVSIDLSWKHRGPDVPALRITHMQRGVPALAPIWFIQGQRTRCPRLVLGHPADGTWPGFFDHASTLSHTQIDPMQASQTGWHASIPGVRFDHHPQDQRGNRRTVLHGQDMLSQRLFPCSMSGCRPTVHRVTRYLRGTASLTDQPVAGLNHEWTDQVNALPKRAPMDPVSSPLNGEACDRFPFSLRGSFRPLFRHVSQRFTLMLNHA